MKIGANIVQRAWRAIFQIAELLVLQESLTGEM